MTVGSPTRTNGAQCTGSANGYCPAVLETSFHQVCTFCRRSAGSLSRASFSQSDCTPEVVVHLIDHLWTDGTRMEDAVAAALHTLDGAYGIVY